jgi:hypothetical protein
MPKARRIAAHFSAAACMTFVLPGIFLFIRSSLSIPTKKMGNSAHSPKSSFMHQRQVSVNQYRMRDQAMKQSRHLERVSRRGTPKNGLGSTTVSRDFDASAGWLRVNYSQV